jgi:type II secretory pathway component PulJ
MTFRALVRRARTISSDERGISVIEMTVAVMLMAIAAAIYLGALTSVYTGVNRQQRRSEINDEARLAMEQIDREVRSGNLLYGPTDSGFSVRVYTQANAPTRALMYGGVNPSGQECVQWWIDGRNLRRRSWKPNSSPALILSDWRTVARDIVNRDVSLPAFFTETGNRVLDVTLVVNNRLGQVDAPRNVRIESSIAIRNTYSGSDPCALPS